MTHHLTYIATLALSLYAATTVSAEDKNSIYIVAPKAEQQVRELDLAKKISFKRVGTDIVFTADGTECGTYPVTDGLTIVFSKPTLPGDANDDGKVNQSDANIIVDYYLGKPTEGINLTNADTNADGEVTISDANKIVNHK